jgi:hypothetical protein
MSDPISMEVDFDSEVGRIEYRIDSFVRIKTVAPHVVAEYDSDDRVLAIEIRALDHGTLHAANDFAEANGLVFPAFMHTYLRASEALNP